MSFAYNGLAVAPPFVFTVASAAAVEVMVAASVVLLDGEELLLTLGRRLSEAGDGGADPPTPRPAIIGFTAAVVDLFVFAAGVDENVSISNSEGGRKEDMYVVPCVCCFAAAAADEAVEKVAALISLSLLSRCMIRSANADSRCLRLPSMMACAVSG